MAMMLSFASICFADNPIIQTNYTADPAPMVKGDTVFLFTSHDEDNAVGFVMNNWMCYTTTDMVNWTDHGIIASLQNFSWQGGSAWAPQACFRNGKWYLYCPLNSKLNGNQMAVGVLTSTSPFGPYTDPINKPLVCCSYDPTILVDDDGQAYMYWGGNGPCYWIKVNQDMISATGSNATASIDFTGTPTNASYTEGPWLYKHDKNYYLAWASHCCPEGIGYAMSTSPMGPWKCKGTIMDPNTNSSGNHPGIIDFKGKSYVFGFDYELQIYLVGSRVGERRSICVKEMTFNDSGTIVKVPWWGQGVHQPSVAQVGHLNPYTMTQAETICFEKGVRTEPCKDTGGGMDVDSIHNGDYIRVQGVDFLSGGAKSFEARVASATSGGNMEVHLDTLTGPLVGSCAVAGTGGWQSWTTKSSGITGATGVHDVYFIFTGGSGLLFNFNWWKFTPSVSIGTASETWIGPRENSVTIVTDAHKSQSLIVDFLKPPAPNNVRVCLFDLTGRLAAELFNRRLSSSRLTLPLNRKEVRPGVYFVKVSLNNLTMLTKTVTFK